jgi:hypothetical protein
MTTMTATRETFSTRFDLVPGMREEMIALLNKRPADAFDIYVRRGRPVGTSKPHDSTRSTNCSTIWPRSWRVTWTRSPIARRRLVDWSRARRQSATNSRLAEFPPDVTGSMPKVEALAERYAALSAGARQAIEIADGQDDTDTADSFTEVSRGLEKVLWFLEAHLQK